MRSPPTGEMSYLSQPRSVRESPSEKRSNSGAAPVMRPPMPDTTTLCLPHRYT